MCSRRVHDVFKRAHGVCIARSRRVRSVFVACSLCVHGLITACSRRGYSAFAVCSLCVHGVLTMCYRKDVLHSCQVKTCQARFLEETHTL